MTLLVLIRLKGNKKRLSLRVEIKLWSMENCLNEIYTSEMLHRKCAKFKRGLGMKTCLNED